MVIADENITASFFLITIFGYEACDKCIIEPAWVCSRF